jgi:metal-responsive CopG/Arc/MetJ family transcriptional regulator
MVKRIISLKLDEEVLEELEELSASMGMSRSDVIRRAIRSYIEKHTQSHNRGVDTTNNSLGSTWYKSLNGFKIKDLLLRV